MDKLKEYFKFFVDNHEELYEKYPNKHVVIQENKVLFEDDTFEGAIYKALGSGLQAGTFLVQHCTEGPEGYTVYCPHMSTMEL